MTFRSLVRIFGNGDDAFSNRTYVLLVAFAVFVVDRLAKLAAFKNLADGQSVQILPNIFHITLVLNTGAAFGLLKHQRVLFVSLSLLIIIFISAIIWNRRWTGTVALFALGLIMGGAIGNLVDRVKFGYVIDFIDFRVWPVFNIADSSITIGTIVLGWNILRQKARRGSGRPAS